MGLAISDEHLELARVARTLLGDRGGTRAARVALDGGAVVPPMWDELAALGWLGLAVGEARGGQGFGLTELAIVAEATGAVVMPGPFVPTAVVVTLLARAADAAADDLVAALARGDARATLVLGAGTPRAWCAAEADVVAVVAEGDVRVYDANAVSVVRDDRLDLTRPADRVTPTGAPRLVLPGTGAEAVRLARVIAAAEAVGMAQACIDAANAYAKIRVQFGRTIGTFQAVKHHLADMLVASELAVAATWDAARAGDDAAGQLAAAYAVHLAAKAASFCSRTAIQLFGGIGFTWEHDAHLYLRRAASLEALLADAGHPLDDAAALVRAGVERGLDLELPPEAETFRRDARAFLEQFDSTPVDQRRALVVDSGYLMPHWPRPWGRGAGAVEQLVLEQEHAALGDHGLGIGSWIVLTLVQHGTPDQLARWVRPSLMKDLYWCQLFSEPDAGSDAAAITTRGVRVDGGWLVTGQKVWTSGAEMSNRGFATVRTDPDAPKHAGVTMMVIDLRAPGVEVRPLRELTGDAVFNEVFLDDVFVPDDDVVGPVNQGWTVARATLGNERVAIGGGARETLSARTLMPALDRAADGVRHERAVLDLLAEEHAMRLLNVRHAVRAIAGGEPGPEGNVTKLLVAEHAQRVTELALQILGSDAFAPEQAEVVYEYLFDRCLSIAGGTSEITRNQIAERLLRLPRDPLVR